MKYISPQEGLLVYEKALLFVRGISPQFDLWPATCAVRDQMDRACESLVVNLMRGAWFQRTEASTSLLLNIAEGNGRFSRLDHRQFIANAEEAGVKLAAYLDLVEPKSPAKSLLREVLAMLEGMKEYLEAK